MRFPQNFYEYLGDNNLWPRDNNGEVYDEGHITWDIEFAKFYIEEADYNENFDKSRLELI